MTGAFTKETKRGQKSSIAASIRPHGIADRQRDAAGASLNSSHISVIELVTIYNSAPASRIHWRNLLDKARRALAKYELQEKEINIAAETLAKAMHMHVEQSGGHQLEEHLQKDLEKHVIDWCGIRITKVLSTKE